MGRGDDSEAGRLVWLAVIIAATRVLPMIALAAPALAASAHDPIVCAWPWSSIDHLVNLSPSTRPALRIGAVETQPDSRDSLSEALWNGVCVSLAGLVLAQGEKKMAGLASALVVLAALAIDLMTDPLAENGRFKL